MMLLVLLQIGGQKTNLLVSFHSFACSYQRNRSGSTVVLQMMERTTLCNIALCCANVLVERKVSKCRFLIVRHNRIMGLTTYLLVFPYSVFHVPD